jgi:hypothetical protein
LQAGEKALDVGFVMVDSIFVLIVKAHRWRFSYGRSGGRFAMLNSEAFTNLSAGFQKQSKLSLDLFRRFTAGGAPVNSGLHKSHAIRRSRCVFFSLKIICN